MKLTVLRRLSCFMCVVVMLCCTSTQAAAPQHQDYDIPQIVPLYVHLQIFDVKLTIENGVATCKTMVQSISPSDSINVDITPVFLYDRDVKFYALPMVCALRNLKGKEPA